MVEDVFELVAVLQVEREQALCCVLCDDHFRSRLDVVSQFNAVWTCCFFHNYRRRKTTNTTLNRGFKINKDTKSMCHLIVCCRWFDLTMLWMILSLMVVAWRRKYKNLRGAGGEVTRRRRVNFWLLENVYYAGMWKWKMKILPPKALVVKHCSNNECTF